MHGTNPDVTFPQAYEKIKANQHAIKVIIDPIRSDVNGAWDQYLCDATRAGIIKCSALKILQRL